MDEINFEFTPEQSQAFTEIAQKIADAINQLSDVMVEIFKDFVERVRKIAEQLGRFFLKMQLLEWRVPAPIADYISQKIYWYWACRLGFAWFKRKTLIE